MTLNRRNLASIARVFILEKDAIDSMPELNLTRTATTGPVVTSGAWVELEFTKLSAEFKETPKPDNGTVTWNVELTGKHVETERFTNDDLNKRWIADITDANGVRLLVGTDEQPLQFSLVQNTGQPNAGHLAVLSLGNSLSDRPPVYVP